MRLLNISLRVLFLFFALFGHAFAEDFYWNAYDDRGMGTPYQGASPKAASTAYFQANCTVSCSLIGSPACTMQNNDPTSFVCIVLYKTPSFPNGYSRASQVSRKGDSCPQGATYEPSTGVCKLPSPDSGNLCAGKDANGVPNIVNIDGECVPYFYADRQSQCKSLANKIESTKYWISFGSDGNPQSPPNPEKYGCKVDFLIGANCKPPAGKPGAGEISMPPNQVARCTVAATFTGEVAPDSQASQAAANPEANQDGQCGPDQNCDVPTPPTEEQKQDCNYVYDDRGARVCSSFQYKGDPGNMDCGSVNGKFECITRPASSNGTKVDTKVETKANSDGSSTTTKTDVATKVECPSGANSCKTTTTTTTTTTSKHANGEVTGSSSQTTCKGDNCSGASSGGGGGGNNGKGDQTTNCDPATDPKACEGASTDGGGKKCDAPIKCDGDAVMCAILQQQHKDTCELMKEPTEEQKSKLQQDTVAEQAKVDALQTELDQKATSLFADFQAKASGSQYGGKCLEDKQVDIMGASFTFPFSQACPYLYLLRYALIAMAYLAAARIVSRGI